MTEQPADRPISDRRLRRMLGILSQRQPDVAVVVENVHDPHNVSAVLRSCDAVGVASAYLLYDQEEMPQLSKGVAASALRWMDIQRFNDLEACYSALRGTERMVYATYIGEEALDLYDLDLTKPCAFVFGNESRGVSEASLRQADARVMIPMAGMVDSLNISVAAAVILYELFRQRRGAGMYDQAVLSEQEITAQIREWLIRERRDLTAIERLNELAETELPRPENRYVEGRIRQGHEPAERR